MDYPFYINTKSNRNYKYSDFLNWLNSSDCTFYKYLHSRSTLTIFQNLLLGLLLDETIILLDSSFSKKEIKDLIGEYEKTEKFKKNNLRFNSVDEVIAKIKISKAKIGLYTSGTTGKPKLVKHNISTFLGTVRIANKYKSDVWGLAYNPTHMAGLQVFFQAFFNKNSIVEFFGSSNTEIVENIEHYDISHISATPTFYNLLDSGDKVFNNVRRVTLGGEKSNDRVLNKLKKIFPNSKINNIYASTEFGTLFISNGTTFSVRKDLEDKVKIEDNNLFVYNGLVGEVEDSESHTIWYNTGDKVRVLSENPLLFKFIGRESSVINIGGYNVFPKEIEDLINSLEGVKIARVYAKKNSVIGNILIADVVKSDNSLITEKNLIKFLKGTLQEFKVPRIIKFVDNILLTRTGKVKR